MGTGINKFRIVYTMSCGQEKYELLLNIDGAQILEKCLVIVCKKSMVELQAEASS